MFNKKEKEKEIYILYYSILSFPLKLYNCKEFNTKEEMEKFCNENATYSFEKMYKGKQLKLKIEE
jgi:glutathione peroxidase-family protein